MGRLIRVVVTPRLRSQEAIWGDPTSQAGRWQGVSIGTHARAQRAANVRSGMCGAERMCVAWELRGNVGGITWEFQCFMRELVNLGVRQNGLKRVLQDAPPQRDREETQTRREATRNTDGGRVAAGSRKPNQTAAESERSGNLRSAVGWKRDLVRKTSIGRLSSCHQIVTCQISVPPLGHGVDARPMQLARSMAVEIPKVRCHPFAAVSVMASKSW